MSSPACSSAAVEVVVCDSWEDFKLRIHADYAESIVGLNPIFRGHASEAWKLSSPWDRKLDDWSRNPVNRSRKREGWNYILDNIILNFKEASVGLPGVRSHDLDDLGWWALGRHHGLVTPLLDWTKSPYVAAFFAFTGYAEMINPGVTTAGDIDPRKFLGSDRGASVAIWTLMAGSVEKAGELKLVNPTIDIGHRQRAQRGLFTTLDHESIFDIEAYISSLRLDGPPPLRKFLVPGRDTARALTELRMMNITFATLFPDISGAALQANFEAISFSFIAMSLNRRC